VAYIPICTIRVHSLRLYVGPWAQVIGWSGCLTAMGRPVKQLLWYSPRTGLLSPASEPPLTHSGTTIPITLYQGTDFSHRVQGGYGSDLFLQGWNTARVDSGP